jgi:hypothetical protein
MEVQIGREIGKSCVEIQRFLIRQIDENKAVKHPHMATLQAVVLLRKVRRHQARSEQRAVESVAPRMVAAGQTRNAALGLGAISEPDAGRRCRTR